MGLKFIRDRGRGPEIEGTRITVYNLLPHFLDPDVTEASICQRYELTPEQVAAARAYVLREPDVILGNHLLIEAKTASGNPPEVIEKAKETHAALLSFKEWLAKRQVAEAQDQVIEGGEESVRPTSLGIPTFKEWLAESQSRSGGGV